MNKTTIYDQLSLINRTKETIKKYGIKIAWLAEQTNIPKRCLSSFLNEKMVLYIPQEKRLISFLDEYDKRMNGMVKANTE